MKTTILRQLIILPLLAILMAALHACGSAVPRATLPATPKTFSATYVLRPGGSAVITPAAVAIGNGAVARAPVVRLERVNDSRCRTGAVCVWAGYISYSFMLIEPDGNATSFVLSNNMPNGTPTATHDGLTFTLAGAQPEAVPSKDEPAPDYQVSLKVSNTNPP